MPPEYQNLEIELATCCCGKPEIRVLQSQFDRPRSRFVFDKKQRAALDLKVAEFEDLLLKESPTETIRRRELAEEIGAELFELLCHDGVRETFDRCYASLRPGERLRLVLSFGVEYNHSLGGLPWELLRKPPSGRNLAREERLSVVRYLDLPERSQPLVLPTPLNVLFVVASPDPATSEIFEHYSRIDLERHRAILAAAMGSTRNLQVRFLHERTACGRATLDGMWKELRDSQQAGTPYHAIHLLCHGAFDDDEGVLLFETDAGAERPVGASELAMCLTEEVRLVVVASCKAGRLPMPRTGVQHAFSGVASALIASGKPAVVAMQFPFSEPAAEAFAGAFYGAIDQKLSVDAGVTAGRFAIAAKGGRNDVEWATPVLFLRNSS